MGGPVGAGGGLLPAAPAPPIQPRALADALLGFDLAGPSLVLLTVDRSPHASGTPRGWSASLNGGARASPPWGASQLGLYSQNSCRTKPDPWGMAFEIFFLEPVSALNTHRGDGTCCLGLGCCRQGAQGATASEGPFQLFPPSVPSCCPRGGQLSGQRAPASPSPACRALLRIKWGKIDGPSRSECHFF